MKKKIINCWNYQDGSNEWEFENDKLLFNFKKVSAFKQCLFDDHFSFYFDLRYKHINVDKVNPKEINLVLIPCPSDLVFERVIPKIPEKIYNFCKENNAIILISFIREFPQLHYFPKINQQINDYVLNKGLKPNQFKILINGFNIPISEEYKKFYLYVDVFDRLMRRYIDDIIYDHQHVAHKRFVKKKYQFLKERKYDFSVLFGNISTVHRTLFFYESDINNLINDRFFYSIINLNKTRTEKTIENTLLTKYGWTNSSSVRDYLKKNIHRLSEHRVYNDDGSILGENQHIYEDWHEWKVPHQVLDSYIHVVLETRLDAPSITEKIYKPIIAGVPFIWIGPQGTLRYLKSKGYKPYSFIDYSFDYKIDPTEKLKALIEEMKRLKNLNLREAVWGDKDIAKHNQKNFYQTTKNFNDFLEKLNEPI